VGVPTLRFEGASTLRGILVGVECGNGTMVLSVSSEGKLLRFAVSDVPKLAFYSQDPDFDGSVNCGPIGHPAFIYYKPMAGQTSFAGDAVAVEFTR
jgi:hypothetical protein